MMRIITILVLLCPHIVMYAQLPDWTRKKPHSTNYYMDYEVGIGVGENYKIAEKEAYLDIMKKLISRCGLSVSANDIMHSIYSDKDFSTIDKDFNLPPIREVCHTQEILPDKKFRVYLLYQVPRDGTIIKPQEYYETFDECDKISQFSNGKALTASFFIPGMGQMIKRNYTEGSLTLLGELALVGGGLGTYFVGKKQLEIMQNRTVEYNEFQSAQKTYKTMRVVSYSCYAVAAALYIFNLYRAYTISPKLKNNIAFYPTLIPEENADNIAIGLSVNVQF